LHKLTMNNGVGSLLFLNGLLLVYVILDNILWDGREFNLLDQLVELLVWVWQVTWHLFGGDIDDGRD
jgi:hypothetical protein